MKNERRQMLEELECQDLCTLESIGRLKNDRAIREVKLSKECSCYRGESKWY